jgi:adenine-specific DNA-methyltransferase
LSKAIRGIEERLAGLNEQELRRLLVETLSSRKLGLNWEHDSIERDRALNSSVVLPRLNEALSFRGTSEEGAPFRNLIIEGDNFDSLRLLRATHASKVSVIYIDPPYNTGSQDWVYNDRYVGDADRWRHSQWLEFLYRRLVLARDLLAPDGVILVSINDENRARLELLMDEVFPGMRVGTFVWRSRSGGNDTKGAFFSDNHEHILVYANAGFRFSGNEKSYSMYKYQEGDRLFRLSDLTKAHDYRERANTYYPIVDPKTGIHYPCNPQRVWAYASRLKLKDGQKLRGDTIEDLIGKDQIWFPLNQRVKRFESEADLLDAIDNGDVPKSGRSALLFRDMPDLAYWVGKDIGYGRPAYKRFKEGLKNENQPISSWLTPRQEAETVLPGTNMPLVGTTEEGSKALKEVMGEKVFQYPKPPSVIAAIVAQAMGPAGILLDFFAGSGTSAHVVLDMNAADGGSRQFIMCSSTEATSPDPERNVCKDVCAARIRRVIEGYENSDGTGGDFAYIELDKIAPADLMFEATPSHATALLSMRVAHCCISEGAGAVKPIAVTEDGTAIVYLSEVSTTSVDALKALPQRRLAVYSPRPRTVAEMLERSGKEGNSYSIVDALALGQAQGAA